jgi:8-oxo-dGTP pyrophosphatase MutT (NUDIX family)
MTKIKKTLKQEGQKVICKGKIFRKAGCCVFTYKNREWWVVTVTSNKGVLSFPKGGIETEDVVENSPSATFRNAGMRELREETGIAAISYHIFQDLITEINEHNPTGKQWNIAYSVGVMSEKVPLLGEKGKGTVAWLPVSVVLSKLTEAPTRRQALQEALTCVISSIVLRPYPYWSTVYSAVVEMLAREPSGHRVLNAPIFLRFLRNFKRSLAQHLLLTH